jgi:hypothetical protein
VQRVRKAINPMCVHLYDYGRLKLCIESFYPCIWGRLITPIMPAAAYLVKCKYMPGPTLIYLSVKKSHVERAAYLVGNLSSFINSRLDLACFKARFFKL